MTANTTPGDTQAPWVQELFSANRVVLVIMAGVYLGFAAALVDLLLRWDTYAERSATVLWFRSAVLAFGLVCLAALLWRMRRGLRPWLKTFDSWLPVRLALYTVLLAMLVTTLSDFQGVLQLSSFLFDRFFGTALLAGLGLWAVLLLVCPDWFSRPLAGVWGLADVVMFNLVVTFVVLEAAITIWAKNSTSPLFLDLGAARDNIERYRREPHTPYFNFSHNSRGYYDEEFFRAEEGDLVVALIADSFGVGVVPYDFNFATVAERRLEEALGDRYQRVAIHNFGIPSIGIPEYAHLLENEVAQTNPRRVLLAIFVGNDIEELRRGKRWRASFRNWWIVTLVRRLWVLRSDSEQTATVAAIGAPTREGSPVPDFVYDPAKEKPTFSPEAFLEVERKRLRISNPERAETQRLYKAFFRALDTIHATLGDRLLLVVIPDEFQVNDTLYETLLARAERPEVYDRDLPQRLLRDYANARDIPILDLLSALRAAEPDGRTYHLRDTHWNARGNRIAGEAIAGFILKNAE